LRCVRGRGGGASSSSSAVSAVSAVSAELAATGPLGGDTDSGRPAFSATIERSSVLKKVSGNVEESRV